MTNEKEVLELAKKHGAFELSMLGYKGYIALKPDQLFSVAATLEEKHQAQIAMLRNALMQHKAAWKHSHTYAHLSDAQEDIAAAFESAHEYGSRVLSATPQSSDAFLAEVRAKAKLEGKIEAMEFAASNEMSNPEFHQCQICGYEWKHGQHGGHDCANTLNAHYEAIRKKNEELQRQLDEAAKQEPVAWCIVLPNGEIDKSDEPFFFKDERDLSELIDGCTKAPLYSLPPNLPALIEQAKAEVRAEYSDVVPRSRMNAVDAEMLELQDKLRKYYEGSQSLIEQAKREEQENIGKLIHYPECWDTAAYPNLEAALMEIHHCSQCYENRDAAIRARSGK